MLQGVNLDDNRVGMDQCADDTSLHQKETGVVTAFNGRLGQVHHQLQCVGDADGQEQGPYDLGHVASYLKEIVPSDAEMLVCRIHDRPLLPLALFASSTRPLGETARSTS